jgi:RHS repeat-associated protein
MSNKRANSLYNRIISIIFASLMALGLAVAAQGQDANKSPERGFHAGGSYALSDIETISRSSGELSLSIPLGGLPAGRGGLSASLKLLYSSKIWDSSETYDHDNENAFEASVLTSNVSGEGNWRYGFMYQLKVKSRKPPAVDTDPCQAYNGYNYQLVLVTPDGAQHPLQIEEQYRALHVDADGWMNIYPDGRVISPCTGTPITGTITYYTTDGTYLRLKLQSGTDNNLLDNPWELSIPDGTVVLGGTVPAPSTAFQKIIDRNGNFIELRNGSYNSHNAIYITDQLNRSIIIEYAYTTDQDRIIVKGANNADLYWIVKWTDISVIKTYHRSDLHVNSALSKTFRVVEQVTLPVQADSLTYLFTYNTGSPANGWGELRKVTLPSGASATYDYLQDNTTGSSIEAFLILRNRPKKKTLLYSTVYDTVAEAHTEIWDYETTYSSGGVAADQVVIETKVTGPDGGISYEYPHRNPNGIYVSEETAKTVNADGMIVERLYTYNLPPNSPPTLNMSNRFVKFEFTTLHDLSKTAIKEYSYDGNGNVLTVKEYDWVNYNVVVRDTNNQPTGTFNSPAPVLLRQTIHTWHLSDGGSNHYSNANSPPLRNAIKSSKVQDGSSTVFSYSEFTYDSPTIKGNLIETKIWDSNKAGLPLTTTPAANYILITSDYDTYGNVKNTYDGKGYQTKFTYDSNNLYPTKIEKAYGKAVQLTTDKVYDFYTGLETEVKDVDNDVRTTMAYDDFGRPKLVKAAEGKDEETQTETTYSDAARRVIVKSDLQVAGDKKLVSITHYDPLGRVRLSRSLEDAATQSATDESTGIKVQKRYRISSPYSYTLTSNPYRAASSGAANQEETMGWTLSKTHNNGRSSEVESFNGGALPQAWGGNNTASTGKVTTAIDANTTTVSDQAGKKRRSVIDGLGRLIRVDEPNANGDFEVSNTPVQPTKYTYDALDNLIKVEQATQTSPVITQTRRYAYDSLKRLIFAANPEQTTHMALSNWAVKYEYDNNSNLVKKIDSRETSPNSNDLLTITYSYDELNRIKTRSYANDPQGTPTVNYDYDDTGVEFAQGRLTKVTIAGVSTTEYVKYDRLGRILQSKQTTNTPDGNKAYPFTYEYNRAGALTREVYPSGKAVATEYDPAGRVAGVKKEGSNYYVGAVATDASNRIQYTAHGAIKALKLGNGLWEHTNFNPRLQPIQIGLGTNTSNSTTLRLDYTYGTTNNNGNVLSQQIVVGTMDVTQSYDYDELNRLQKAEEKLSGSPFTSQWKQSFTYDRFGNRKFDAGQTMPASVLGAQLDFSTASNRISSASYDYDSAGNVKQEPASPTNKGYAYDGENHQVSYSFNGATTHYVYDGDGKRVMKWDGSGAIVYVYDALGRLAAEYTTTAPQNNGISYLTTDHLGSTRVVTNDSGGVKARHDYLPFGEEMGLLSGRTLAMGYSQNEGLRQKFTEKERDAESGLDYFLARYYSSTQGRFISPDEFAGGSDEFWNLGSGDGKKQALVYADIVQPQSLNKYQYCLNNPLRYIDSDGHQTVTRKKKKGGADNNGESMIKILGAAPFGLGAIALSLIIDPPSVYAPSEGEEFERPSAEELIENERRAMGVAIMLPKVVKGAGKTISHLLGEAGQEALAKLVGGKSQVSITLANGERRVVDQLVTTPEGLFAHESKVGYKYLDKDIERQLANDTKLLKSGTVQEITWHFFLNPNNGTGGLSKGLQKALDEAGIKVEKHYID